MPEHTEIIEYSCGPDPMFGILHRSGCSARRGILVLGRVGTHRQHVLLARSWAASGIPVMRFDLRGRGESGGDWSDVEAMKGDLSSAVDAFVRAVPELVEIAVYGLCQDASAALICAHRDARVTGLILVNPWTGGSGQDVQQTIVRRYVLQLADRTFWTRLARYEGGWRAGWRSAFATAMTLLPRGWRGSGMGAAAVVPEIGQFRKMTQSLVAFRGNVLLILSGADPAAGVFKGEMESSREWRRMIGQGRVTVAELPEANHAFSRGVWREQMLQWTTAWVREGVVVVSSPAGTAGRERRPVVCAE